MRPFLNNSRNSLLRDRTLAVLHLTSVRLRLRTSTPPLLRPVRVRRVRTALSDSSVRCNIKDKAPTLATSVVETTGTAASPRGTSTIHTLAPLASVIAVSLATMTSRACQVASSLTELLDSLLPAPSLHNNTSRPRKAARVNLVLVRVPNNILPRSHTTTRPTPRTSTTVLRTTPATMPSRSPSSSTRPSSKGRLALNLLLPLRRSRLRPRFNRHRPTDRAYTASSRTRTRMMTLGTSTTPSTRSDKTSTSVAVSRRASTASTSTAVCTAAARKASRASWV